MCLFPLNYIDNETVAYRRFPGQEHVAGNSKIPSIMYYDQHGNMKAAGAEADGASVLAQAEDEGWSRIELYAHLCLLGRFDLLGSVSSCGFGPRQ